MAGGGADHGRTRRALLVGVVASLSASALLAIGILLFGDFGETEGRILATTALVAGYGLLALPAGVLLDRSRSPALAVVLLTLAATALVLATVAVWMGDPPDALVKTTVTLTAFGVAAAQTAALAARRRERDPRLVDRLYLVSVGLAVVLAAMVAGAVWTDLSDDGYYRVLAALAVLDLLMVALQPILALTRSAAGAYRLRVVVDSGEEIETTVAGVDFGAAAGRAIRTIEGRGQRVVRVERIWEAGQQPPAASVETTETNPGGSGWWIRGAASRWRKQASKEER